MQDIILNAKRVERFLRRQAKSSSFRFDEAPDPRQFGKVKYRIGTVIGAVFGGLLRNDRTLRQLEAQGGSSAPLSGSSRISDTQLHDLLPRFDQDYLTQKLVAQVKHMQRKKMLKGADLPVSVIAIDGKNLGKLSHDGAGHGHHRSSPAGEKWGTSSDGVGHWYAPVLRGVLVSAEQRPIMLQMAIPVGTGEAAVFADFFEQLDKNYSRGGFVDVITADAGMCSLKNADTVAQAGATYVFGLKGNQTALHDAAQFELQDKVKQNAPEAQTGWEPRSGAKLRRQLWRTDALVDFETCAGTWSHLSQTWLVRQTTQHPDGRQEIEDRYFVTNMTKGRLTPTQMLTLVRAHWRIENDAFNSLDMQWGEDSGRWCKTGAAMWTLSLLRCMAYNLIQHLRRCHLRKKTGTAMQTAILPWASVFEAVAATVLLAAHGDYGGSS